MFTIRRNPVQISLVFILFIIVFAGCKQDAVMSPYSYKQQKEALGKKIFFDKSLSNPTGQSCSSCHSPATAFSDPEHRIVSEGAVQGLYGNRNAPAIMYAMYAPTLYYNSDDSTYMGGLFLDGRVNTLEQQARQPFLNKLEMGNTDIAMVVNKIRGAEYYSAFTSIYGTTTDANTIFNEVADALAAYERSAELNPFTSKYDYYLKGQATLTTQELRGLKLFNDTLKGKCANCHVTDPDPISGKVLFTDFSYDNIGVPQNPKNPYYTIPIIYNSEGAAYIDYGLGGFLKDKDVFGQFKVPTLRNITLSAPYFHNGYFNTLEDVVHFYNTRDVGTYPPAEIPGNVNHEELGDLHLTDQEEADIVAFLKTLTDGYK